MNRRAVRRVGRPYAKRRSPLVVAIVREYAGALRLRDRAPNHRLRAVARSWVNVLKRELARALERERERVSETINLKG